MRISVVSDIHGNIDALARVADAADQLLVLGDLLDYVDYADPAGGVLGQVFGAGAVSHFAALRRAGEFAALHAYDRELWASVSDPVDTLEGIVADLYQKIVNVLPDRTLLILGNVDIAQVWARIAPPPLRSRDAEALEIGGLRVGFVAGGCLKRPPEGSPWRSYDRLPYDYRASLASLPAVDVLCSHLPPDIEELRFDVRAGRAEMCGPGLLEFIDEHQPKAALFGHVHADAGSSAWRNSVH